MSAKRERRDYALKASSDGWGSLVPSWYLRLRLRATDLAIDRLERRLADEFGLLETAPLHRELETLLAEREALSARLRERD